MKTEGEGRLLRIYVGESDRWEGRPLYEALVRAAREQGLAGATALRGIEGFGASTRIHTVKVLHLSEDLPVVVEIVDGADRIAAFIPTVDKMVGQGMATLQNVDILLYRNGGENARPADDELQLESPAERTPNDAEQSSIPLTKDGRQIIAAAKDAATACRRVYVDSIDVLFALLRENEGIAGRALAKLQIDLPTVERCLREQVSRDEPPDAYLTALELKSLAESGWLGHQDVGTEHLLLALCEIRPSAATDILMRLGVQPRDICKEVLDILGHHDDWQRWLADHPDM
jgi:PII-like signaling protein